MEIETKLLSIETIKPSSPTPKSLQKHQLSLIDQSLPSSFMPLICLYASNPKTPNSEKSKQLKKSLSAVLTRFYPLAGRLVGNLYVDCNDEGIPFFEAEADCDLSQAMPHSDHKVLDKLLPFKMDEPQDFCMAVQATYFRCGGLALAILVSHKIADGLSALFFIYTWFAFSRNEDVGGIPLPKFDSAAYFPPLEVGSGSGSGSGSTFLVTKEDITAKLFTFPAEFISLLRERYSGGDGERPSRVEALSAFIWTVFVSARTDPNKIHCLLHMVNARSRTDPPLSLYHFGNIVGFSKMMTAAGDGGVELVRKIRESVKAVDHDFAAQMMSNLEIVKHLESGEMMVRFTFSSLCGLPVYEADFGWGGPVWVGVTRLPFKNIAYLVDTKTKGGIEALIHLTKQDMEKFEHHLKQQMFQE